MNLFALRSTDPSALFTGSFIDAEGPDNDTIIRAAAQMCEDGQGVFVCAWGSPGRNREQRHYVRHRAATVRGIVEGVGVDPMTLRLSQASGQPWHPLYLPATLTPQPWTA